MTDPQSTTTDDSPTAQGGARAASAATHAGAKATAAAQTTAGANFNADAARSPADVEADSAQATPGDVADSTHTTAGAPRPRAGAHGSDQAAERRGHVEPGPAVVEPGPPDADPATLQERLDERNDHYLRLAADFENFKRRKAQELVNSRRYASEDAALALLPVLDNLRRALSAVPGHAEDDALVQGVRLVAREFEAALERIGVTPIESVGEPFNPAHHQAVASEESSEVEQDTVTAEYQRGYRLHDKVLRPAMVRIAHPQH